MSTDSQKTITFDDDDNFMQPPNEIDKPSSISQSQDTPHHADRQKTTDLMNQSQPLDIFRRTNSIEEVKVCRDSFSFVDPQCFSKFISDRPQVLTQSALQAMADGASLDSSPNQSASSSNHKSMQMKQYYLTAVPEDEVISYKITTIQEINRHSDATIRQLQSSSDSMQSLPHQVRRVSLQTTPQKKPRALAKRNTVFIPKVEANVGTLGFSRSLAQVDDIDIPNPLLSIDIDVMSVQQSIYQLHPIEENFVPFYVEELVGRIQNYLNHLPLNHKDSNLHKSFSFEKECTEIYHLEQQEDIVGHDQLGLIARLALEQFIDPHYQNSPKVFHSNSITSKFKSILMHPSDKTNEEIEALKQEIEVWQSKCDIADCRMIEYYDNEQKAKKHNKSQEAKIKQLIAEIEIKNTEILALKQDAEQSSSDKEQPNQADYQDQNEDLQRTIQFLEKIIHDKAQQLTKSQDEIKGLRLEKADLKLEFVEQVKERDSQLQSSQHNYLELSKQIQAQKQVNQDLQSQLEHAQSENTHQQGEHERLTHKFQNLLEELQSQEHEYTNNEQLAQYEDKMVDIEKKLHFYRAKVEDLAKEQKRVGMDSTYSQFLSTRRVRDEQAFNLHTIPTQHSNDDLPSPPQKRTASKENSQRDYTRHEDVVPKVVLHVQSQNTMNGSHKLARSKSPLAATRKRQVYTPTRTTNNPTQHYKGDIHQGLRHGRGKQVYPDGHHYQGGWHFDKKEGFGTIKKGDKEVYSGHWHFDLKHGCGHLINQNMNHVSCTSIDYKDLELAPWSAYQGEFKEDQYGGFGVLNFKTGERFHGVFSKGKANGKGTFYRIDGEIIPGVWVNGRLRV